MSKLTFMTPLTHIQRSFTITFDITSFPQSTWTETLLDILCTIIIAEPILCVKMNHFLCSLGLHKLFSFIDRNVAGFFPVIISGTYFPILKTSHFLYNQELHMMFSYLNIFFTLDRVLTLEPTFIANWLFHTRVLYILQSYLGLIFRAKIEPFLT